MQLHCRPALPKAQIKASASCSHAARRGWGSPGPSLNATKRQPQARLDKGPFQQKADYVYFIAERAARARKSR